MANHLVPSQQVAREFRPQLEAFAHLEYESQMKRLVKTRQRRQRRLQRNDAGFPSVNDIDKALKLAKRVDPVLVEMMKANDAV